MAVVVRSGAERRFEIENEPPSILYFLVLMYSTRITDQILDIHDCQAHSSLKIGLKVWWEH